MFVSSGEIWPVRACVHRVQDASLLRGGPRAGQVLRRGKDAELLPRRAGVFVSERIGVEVESDDGHGERVPPTRPNGVKAYQVDKLQAQHRLAVILKTLAGFKNKEIARVVGRTEAWVGNTLNHPHAEMLQEKLMTDFVQELTQDTTQLIAGAAREAVGTIIELMRHGESERVRLSAAVELKNTAGFKPVERNFNMNADLKEVLDHETGKLFAQAARELAEPVGDYKPVADSAKALGHGQSAEEKLDGFPISRGTPSDE